MDMTGLIFEGSNMFNDVVNNINGKLHGPQDRCNHYKEFDIDAIYGKLMFKEMEWRVQNGILFIGAEFDDLYMGRPQIWSETESTLAKPGQFGSQP